jgi:hypothetical protein
MMDALLRDDRLRWDLARLASNMDQLMPDGLGEGYEFSGEQPLGLEPALERIGQLQALDRLEDQLGMVESPEDLAGLDRDEVRELLGPDSARDLEASTSSPAAREAGYLSRKGDRLELTRAAVGGSARRSSTTCSPACRGMPSAGTGSTAPAGAGSARRRRSRTSSATRSTSTSGARSRTPSAGPRTAPTSGSPAANPASTSRRRTSRSSGPSS